MNLYYFSYLKNVLYREPSFILKYYLHKKNGAESDEYIYMADGKMIHGGLFDRLKGAISIYALSKVHGKPFRAYFTEPFCLEKYLEPNHYDWKKNEKNLLYAYPYSRPVIAYSELHHPKRLIKEREGQMHFYFGGNILENINHKYGTAFEWTSLYNELFRPSEYLQKHVEVVKNMIGKEYYAIHLRFLNLLGENIEKQGNKTLSGKDRKELITLCLKDIKEIISKQPKEWKPVIFSDSMFFLKIVKNELTDVHVVPGNVKHIDNTHHISEDEDLKVFTDMYLMVDAQKVFSIVGKGMHPSAFPEYSARIGGKPFERINYILSR